MENLPITVKYYLTDDEIKSGTDRALGVGRFSSAIVRTVILAVLVAVFTRQYILPSVSDPNYFLGGLLVGICVILAVISWVIPSKNKLKFINDMTEANDFSVTFLENQFVVINKLGTEEKIGIDDISVSKSDELYIIKSSSGGFLFIPQRVVSEEYSEIRKILEERIV